MFFLAGMAHWCTILMNNRSHIFFELSEFFSLSTWFWLEIPHDDDYMYIYHGLFSKRNEAAGNLLNELRDGDSCGPQSSKNLNSGSQISDVRKMKLHTKIVLDIYIQPETVCRRCLLTTPIMRIRWSIRAIRARTPYCQSGQKVITAHCCYRHYNRMKNIYYRHLVASHCAVAIFESLKIY